MFVSCADSIHKLIIIVIALDFSICQHENLQPSHPIPPFFSHLLSASYNLLTIDILHRSDISIQEVGLRVLKNK